MDLIVEKALVDVDTTSLNSSKVVESVMSLTSSESLQTAASEIQSVLGQIGANVAVVENVIQTLENVSSVSYCSLPAMCCDLFSSRLIR